MVFLMPMQWEVTQCRRLRLRMSRCALLALDGSGVYTE